MTVYEFTPKTAYEFKTQTSPYELHFSPGKYLVELQGAAAGTTTAFQSNPGGKGGYTKGIISINNKTTFYLFVGSKGGDSFQKTGGKGGFNGGVDGPDDEGSGDCGSAGSGGATDLRTTLGLWNDTSSLLSRIMVAGGGGSSGCYKNAGLGGDAGGIDGENGKPTTSSYPVDGGKGATQTTGYHIGYGEKGTSPNSIVRGESPGSGGGGYWGGFAGKSSKDGTSASGAGGGSSFISGNNECIAMNEDGSTRSNSFHFSGLNFTNSITISGFNSGDGKAFIKGLTQEITCLYFSNRFSFVFFISLFVVVSKQ